jgi:hypothetical protein
MLLVMNDDKQPKDTHLTWWHHYALQHQESRNMKTAEVIK